MGKKRYGPALRRFCDYYKHLCPLYMNRYKAWSYILFKLLEKQKSFRAT